MTKNQFKRILFKVSGEAMMGDSDFGHNEKAISNICQQIVQAKKAIAKSVLWLAEVIFFVEFLLQLTAWIALVLITWECLQPASMLWLFKAP